MTKAAAAQATAAGTDNNQLKAVTAPAAAAAATMTTAAAATATAAGTDNNQLKAVTAMVNGGGDGNSDDDSRGDNAGGRQS
jgi:hypothetical protein